MSTMEEKYDYRNCQSLFGYAQEIHKRSGGICQLCRAGQGTSVSFDLWRQLTVEHLIGESQGGHYRQILKSVSKKYDSLTRDALEELAEAIEMENMVTACSFCNSMTSKDQHDISMYEIIASAQGPPESLITTVHHGAQRALARKQANIRWKLSSIRKAFRKKVLPELIKARM